jgi:hypothetical protein
LATFLIAALACASSTAAEDPAWGKQPCAHCHMLVSDPHTAAQLATRAGEHLYFDDVGCLIEHLAGRSGERPRAWIRDANGQWLDAFSARYRSGASTPMGYGIVADPHGSLDFFHAQHEVALHRVARSTP